MFKVNVSDCRETLSDDSAEFLQAYPIPKRLNYPKVNFAKIALPLSTAKFTKFSIIARLFSKRASQYRSGSSSQDTLLIRPYKLARGIPAADGLDNRIQIDILREI